MGINSLDGLWYNSDGRWSESGRESSLERPPPPPHPPQTLQPTAVGALMHCAGKTCLLTILI